MPETKPTLSLHRKLAQVMHEADRIPKNGTAPAAMGGFKFVQVGDAADVIRKALAEQVISMIPTAIEVVGETEHAASSGKMMTTLTVRTTWTLTDGESGETTVIQSLGSGADMGDKAAPKAQSNAMKYALLMGFLLSTGDDPEQTDSSDRQRRQPPRDVTHEAPQIGQDGLIGTVEKGKAPVDMEPRQTPNGLAWGFKLKDGSRSFQVLATGSLADVLSMVPDLTGQRVTCYGTIEMIPWDNKAGKAMPPYPRLHLSRIATPDYVLPSELDGAEPEPTEPDTAPLFDDVA